MCYGSVPKTLSDRLHACPGIVRSQGRLPRASSENRFSDPILSDQENCHGLPALPLVVDHRAAGANGSWLPALQVPGRFCQISGQLAESATIG